MRPDLPPHRRPVNTVFQKYALFPHLNVFDNIAFGLKLKNTPKDTIVQKVKNALRMVNYSPQATTACLVATAAAMWSLTDSCFACVLFNDNRDNRDNFFKDFFKKRKIKGTIFYVLVLFSLTHKKLSLLSLKQKFPKTNCLYCLYCRLKPRYDLKRPSLREIIGCIFNSSTRSTTAE